MASDGFSFRETAATGGGRVVSVGVGHSCDTSSGDFLRIFQLRDPWWLVLVFGWKYLQIDGDNRDENLENIPSVFDGLVWWTRNHSARQDLRVGNMSLVLYTLPKLNKKCISGYWSMCLILGISLSTFRGIMSFTQMMRNFCLKIVLTDSLKAYYGISKTGLPISGSLQRSHLRLWRLQENFQLLRSKARCVKGYTWVTCRDWKLLW